MAAFSQIRPRFSPRLTIVQRIHRSIYTGAGATTKTSSRLCGYNQSRRPPRRSRRRRRRLRIRRSTRRSAADFNARRWIPVTKLGRLVKEGRIRSNAVHKSNCRRKLHFRPRIHRLICTGRSKRSSFTACLLKSTKLSTTSSRRFVPVSLNSTPSTRLSRQRDSRIYLSQTAGKLKDEVMTIKPVQKQSSAGQRT